MNHAANTAFEAAKQAFASLAQGPRHIHWEDLPGWVRNYIVEHPGLTAAQIIWPVILAAPAIITMPLLGALGFTSLGPAAGKQQDTSLTKHSSRIVPSNFRHNRGIQHVQSYMMAGYGVPIVGGIVQAGAAVAGVGTSVWAWASEFPKNGTQA